jgi:hypothetical protein
LLLEEGWTSIAIALTAALWCTSCLQLARMRRCTFCWDGG